MSGVDTELTDLTTRLIREHSQATNDDERKECIRTFVAKVHKRRYQTGEGGEGKKDVMLDLDTSAAVPCQLVAPAKPGATPETWEVQVVFLRPTQLAIDSEKLIRIGSCVWTGGAILDEAGYVIHSIEPVWDAKGKEYKLCEVEEAK